jgi:hypothetical protein
VITDRAPASSLPQGGPAALDLEGLICAWSLAELLAFVVENEVVS